MCRYPNVYGIDMPSRQELVAHGRTEKEVCEHIGADLVVFQQLDDLVASCSQFNSSIKEFECSVFTGKYISGGVDEQYLAHIEGLRADHKKSKERSEAGVFVEPPAGCSGPMSGAEANITVGLPDARSSASRRSSNGNDQLLGLSNSRHSSFNNVQEAPDREQSTPRPPQTALNGKMV